MALGTEVRVRGLRAVLGAAGYVSNEWDMARNPRTNAAWTLGDVNAGLELGFQDYPVPGSWPYVTQAYVVITYHTADTTTYVGGIYEAHSEAA